MSIPQLEIIVQTLTGARVSAGGRTVTKTAADGSTVTRHVARRRRKKK